MMKDYFHIGTITSPHGIRGDVNVYPITDDPEHLRELRTVVLAAPGSEDRSDVRKVERVRYGKTLVIFGLEGVADRNQAESLRGYELFIAREDASPLGENEFYIADLIGLDVFADGESFGTLRDVMQTGANDVYVVDSPKYGEVLIPAIKDCVLKIAPEEGRMDVHLLPGLVRESEDRP